MEASQLTESNLLAHGPCDSCGSSDALGVYDDGHSYCYSCSTYKPSSEGSQVPQVSPKETPQQKALLQGEVRSIKARGLTEETCRKFGYLVSQYNGEPVQVANYRNKDGVVVAQKLRTANKDFSILGDAKKMTLYGSHLFSRGRKLVICEGEIDTCTVSQIQGHKWATVGLPNGVAAATRTIKDNWDYIMGFDEVILMFDQDKPGQDAALKCAEIFPAGKVKIAGHLPFKDPNECLLNNESAAVVTAIFQARDYRPDGIVAASDFDTTIGLDDAASSISYPYERLNSITGGIRKGEMVTICAGSGSGKTTFCKEIAYHLHQNLDQQVGLLMLEESNKRTLRGLVGLHLNKNITVDPSQATQEEIEEAFRELFAPTKPPLYLFDHWGSSDVDLICQRITYMVKALGCQWVILDHVSVMVSGLATGDERKLIDIALTKLATLTQELQIGLIIVSHLRRPDGDKGHEDGAVVRLGQLRGSHSIAQLSSMCISLQIDPDDPAGDTRSLHVLKNRWSGEGGYAGTIKYNRATGRLLDQKEMF